jgi:transposase-like protein
MHRVVALFDADGHLVDARLSEKRDMDAAQQFSSKPLPLLVMLQSR